MAKHAPAQAAMVLVLICATLGIAACGSATTNVKKSATTPSGAFTSRERVVRGCLEKRGVLPVRESAQRPHLGGTLASRIADGVAGPGVNLVAAAKSCGVGSTDGPSLIEVLLDPRTVSRYLDRWTACIAVHGYLLPTPNTSGDGPIFPFGTDRVSGYERAASRCRPIERQELKAMARAART